jgi:hypothetical protein
MAKIVEYAVAQTNDPIWVNLDHVTRIAPHPSGGSVITFTDGTTLYVSAGADTIATHANQR